MITAERLEELIKQGATIYHILFNGFDLVDLTKIKELDRNNHFQYYNDCFSQYVRANNKDLYETQEQAEWYCKMTAERTERFEPPMWEDLPIKWDFYFVKDKHMFHFGYENYNGDKQNEKYIGKKSLIHNFFLRKS